MNNRIRQLREEVKMSQIDLAKVFNITSATISQYELGKRFPDQETLEKLADYFDVSVDYLLGRTDIRTAEKAPEQKIPDDMKVIMRDMGDLSEEQRKIIIGIMNEFRESNKKKSE